MNTYAQTVERLNRSRFSVNHMAGINMYGNLVIMHRATKKKVLDITKEETAELRKFLNELSEEVV